MVIDNLNIFWAICCPAKADAKLVIDPNTPLTSAVTSQRFKPVSRWHAHVFKCHCKIKLHELAQGLSFNLGKALVRFKPEQGLCVF